MRQAFLANDIAAVISTAEKVFQITAPASAKANAAVYTGTIFNYAIDIFLDNGIRRMRYVWHEYEGFSSVRVPGLLASAAYRNTPPIRIWRKTDEAA